ncbi:anthranilate synthase component I family protein [Saccharothrix sp. Mg75]|uniref:anthranilate synthase component I family protein n=1 Tax=Saccharothrix sp. Mg75 TaxID=3445357 RepID=UPI003EED7FE3
MPRTAVVEVVVTAEPVRLRTSAAVPLRAALCARYGDDEVFLLEDLHPDGVDRRAGTVVGVGKLAELSVTGRRVRVRGEGPVADALREHCAGAAPGGEVAERSAVWELLRGATNLFDVRTDVPWQRYAFGFLTMIGYDAVGLVEDLPPREAEPSVPDVTIALFQRTVWFGDGTGDPVVVTASGPLLPEPPDVAGVPPEAEPGALPEAPVPLSVTDTVDRETFLAGVRRCLDHVRVGDVYQIVVGHRVDVRTGMAPQDVYRRLRDRNPSPYTYLVTLGGVTLVGASPELLFRLVDGRLLMRPIAGTARRDPTGVDDERRVKELLADVKEQAEHVMLVDLGRNDVGRVVDPGTLRVDEMMAVEAFSHVFHLVSTVSGRMSAGRDVWDAVCATFPAGTVTGAPKVRAMEIIDDVEPTRRGAYAGALGLVDVRGWAELALCIRTVVHHGEDGGAHHYSTQAGAGVVALSEPEREWDETLAKMGAAFWALTGEEPR